MTGKPAILPLHAENLPLNDLREYPHAITWEYQWQEDRNDWTKVPINALTGAHASSTNPATWSTPDVVLDLHDRFGYVMTEQNPFTFIDLDDSGDYETGFLKPWATDIMKHFPETYWEWSPSGTGLKGLIRGKVPRNRAMRHADGKVEIYSTGKYTTLTGQITTHSANRIADGQEGIDWLFASILSEPMRDPVALASLDLEDEEIAERVERMAKGYRLYRNGDISDYDGDDSEADLGLLDLLIIAGATDAGQLDRLYRSSALMRDKWERASYREPTIRKALDGTVRPGDWNSPKNRVVMRDTQDACHPPEGNTVAELRQIIAEKDRIIAALEHRVEVAERIAREAKAKARLSEKVQHGVAEIIRNKHLGQERFTAIALAHRFAHLESTGNTGEHGMHDINVGSVAAVAGVSNGTASRHIAKLVDGGEVKKELVWVNDEIVNKATGEIRPGHWKQYLGLNGGGVTEFIEKVATMEPEKAKTWGGRSDRCRPCLDHPEAPVIKRVTYHCSVCGKETGREDDKPVDGSENGVVVRDMQDACLIDERNTSVIHSVENVLIDISDEVSYEEVNPDDRWDA